MPAVPDCVLAELAADALDEHFDPIAQRLTIPGQRLDGVSTATLLGAPHEAGTWSLEYLGPGFRVQLRVARRERQARVDGWIAPAQPMTVLLTSLLRNTRTLEVRASESGRFEFPVAPTGACRMSFVTTEHGRLPLRPSGSEPTLLGAGAEHPRSTGPSRLFPRRARLH